MTRPKLSRRLFLCPKVTFYKPQGVRLCSLESVELTHEEWESLRLKHMDGLNQNESAKKMNTSQSTFQRILSSAQRKLGQAVVKGLAIKINKEL